MKFKFTLLAVLLVGALAFVACNNDDDKDGDYLPNSTVIHAFNTRYPTAGQVSWSASGSYQKAEFTLNGNECDAWFDNQGTWLLAQTDMPYASLPQAVKTGFSQSFYAQWQVDDAGQLERLDMPTLYWLEVENGGNEMTLYFNEEGLLVKEVTGDHGEGSPIVLSQKIRSFIAQKYPSAVIVDADPLADGMTEVDILDGGRVKELLFSTSEEWLYTKWEVAESEVPQVVLSVLGGEAFQGYGIDDVEYRVYASGQEYYHFELEKTGSLDMTVNIDPQGNIVLN